MSQLPGTFADLSTASSRIANGLNPWDRPAWDWANNAGEVLYDGEIPASAISPYNGEGSLWGPSDGC